MSRRVFWGSGLLLVGLLLLASNLGFIGDFSLWSLWPLLIIWPALRFLTRRMFVTVGRGSRTGRIYVGRNWEFRLFFLWVLAGATAQLLYNLNLIPYTWGNVAYWTLPALLVAIGVAVLLRPRGGRRTWFKEEWKNNTDPSPGGISSWIGDIHYGSRPWVFKSPMTVDLWIGDIDLDLSTAQFGPGENRLYVSMWAGDLDIRAPEGIDVEVRAACSAGELRVFDEHRSGLGLSLTTVRPSGGEPGDASTGGESGSPCLLIDVDLTFGDVRVR